MKKLILTILLLAAGRLYAISPIGPAASTLQKGQLNLGFDCSRTWFDDLPMDFKFKTLGLTLGPVEIPLSDNVTGYWAKLGYGISDRADIFLRLGVAGFDSASSEFAWGLGGRFTIVESERLDWGLLAQINWFGGDDEGMALDETVGPVSYRGNLSFRKIQIAAGPVYKGDNFSVYGGPLVSWMNGDGDFTLSDGLTTIDASFDCESDLRFGGYLGLSLAVKDNVAVKAEVQFTEHTRAITGGLSYRF